MITSNKNYCMLSDNMRKNSPEPERKISFFRIKCWDLKNTKMLSNIWRNNLLMHRVTGKNLQIMTGKEENSTELLKRKKPLSPKWRKRWRTSMKKISICRKLNLLWKWNWKGNNSGSSNFKIKSKPDSKPNLIHQTHPSYPPRPTMSMQIKWTTSKRKFKNWETTVEKWTGRT